MVERQLPKLNVAGSSPVFRSSKNRRKAVFTMKRRLRGIKNKYARSIYVCV